MGKETKRPDIDAVVLDVGNVLILFDPKARLAEKYGQEMAEKIHPWVFGSKHWLEMDRGILTEDEVKARMKNDAPAELAEWIDRAIADYPPMGIPMPESLAYLPRLKAAGYKLYILSNYGEQYFEITNQLHPVFGDIDGFILSGREKVLKPTPHIYRALLDRFNLVPERSIFYDDVQANIDGAKKLGMQGRVFTTPSQFDELLIPVP